MMWSILGYSAMPAIIIVGFIMTSIATCVLLDILGKGSPE